MDVGISGFLNANIYVFTVYNLRPVVAQVASQVRDCKHDWLWVRSRLEEMKYLFKFIFAFSRSGAVENVTFSSATQHAMLPEFGGMWETECLNTRFPLPALLCAGYSV